MTVAKDKKLGRQLAYKSRASAARMLGKLLFLVLMGTASYAAWSEPKIKAQLETGLETIAPIATSWIERSTSPAADQTAQLDTPESDIKINRP